MNDGKAVLKCLGMWIQTAASRILELPKYINIKRRIRRNIKRGIRRNIEISIENTIVCCYCRSLFPLILPTPTLEDLIADRESEEACDHLILPTPTLEDLIADREFEEACDHVCRIYGQKITERCTEMLRPYVPNPEADGKEVAQQVFLEFWRILRAGKYDPSKDVHGLLFTIAERRAIGKLRTRNRIVPGRDTDLDEIDRKDWQESHLSNPEVMVLEDEERKIVSREVERLPFSDRQILNLHYTLGHSTETIAQFVGEKRGTIASRISRAYAKLRTACNSDD